MSARPDLTTEELIRWCEAFALEQRATHYAITAERLEAIAQRLRSERPAVTPSIRDVVNATVDCVGELNYETPIVTADKRQPDLYAAVEARLAVLSVLDTEGKP